MQVLVCHGSQAGACCAYAGVPANNASLYCDSSSGICYSLSTSTATYAAAASDCVVKGGRLWVPQTAAESGLVEGPLGLTSNSTTIWIGLNRTSTVLFEWCVPAVCANAIGLAYLLRFIICEAVHRMQACKAMSWRHAHGIGSSSSRRLIQLRLLDQHRHCLDAAHI